MAGTRLVSMLMTSNSSTGNFYSTVMRTKDPLQINYLDMFFSLLILTQLAYLFWSLHSNQSKVLSIDNQTNEMSAKPKKSQKYYTSVSSSVKKRNTTERNGPLVSFFLLLIRIYKFCLKYMIIIQKYLAPNLCWYQGYIFIIFIYLYLSMNFYWKY